MSILLIKHRLLHLHIPRTAGTWIRDALRILGDCSHSFFRMKHKSLVKKHCLLYHYRKGVLNRFDVVFTFVRHPVDYYESVWKWLNRAGVRGRKRSFRKTGWHPFKIPYYNWNPDFNIWVENMLETHPGWVSHLFDLYVGPEGGEFCDYIGRTENLVSDFCEIVADYNLYDDRILSIEKQNAIDVGIVWDDGLKKDVIESEHMAIERFYGDNFNKLRYSQNALNRIRI